MSTQLIQLGNLSEYEDRIATPDPILELDIKKARCNRYIPNKEKKDAKELCYCGRTLEAHDEGVIEVFKTKGVEENEKWDIYNPLNKYVVEDGLTNAYGDIKFVDNSEHMAKYIRVHYKTDPSKMVKLLFEYWKLNEPKLLISVTGGAQKFSLKTRLREVFRRGLIKAAVSTSAWISTGGFNVGVMKHVGEAIRNNSTSLNTSEKIVVLGIASWTMVLHNETLIKESLNKKESIEYRLSSKNEKDRRQPLDPNHSHFILVDNSQIKFGGEIDFRAALESAISKHRPESPIPIVVLVLEGGVGTLKTVLESVKNGTPCVFVEGSGKCADIFAYALKYMMDKDKEGKEETRIDSRLESEIKMRIKREWPESDLEKTYKQIEQTLEYRDLLTAFTLDADDQTPEIDVAILTALLKAKKGNYIAQLKLALRWNRVDIARNYIFNQDIKWESKQLDEIMYNAIMDDSVDFVNLLLQNGFNLSMFLTNRCLLKLYNDALRNKKNKSISYLLEMKNRTKTIEKKSYDFYEIGSIIQTLVEDLYEPKFKHYPYNKINLKMALAETNDIGKVHSHLQKALMGVTANIHSDLDLDARCEDPEHELFIFSILLMRPGMSKVFWREGSNEIFLALLTTKIFKTLASLNDEESNVLNEFADDFESMAISVLNDCYSRDETRAELLLIKEIPQFGNLTSLQVAVSANDLTFMSQPCVQGLLTKLWYNKIMSDTPKPIIGLSVLCPPIAPFCIEYREDRRHRISVKKQKKDDLDTANDFSSSVDVGFLDSGKKLSYFEKIYFFVKAPVVKFLYNQISYILFLMLFSYIMLCDFYQIPRPEDSDDDIDDGSRRQRLDYDDNDEDVVGYKLPISVAEVILIFWVIMHTLDQIRQFFETDAKVLKARLRVYFYNFWNSVELVAILLYFIGMVLRFIPNNHDTYITARIIFCIDLIFWYLKALSYYAVIRNLGPKLVMINRMMYELMYFVLIVIVFAFAFGVSTQSLMFHNQELTPELLKEVFFPSYFVIGGEYYTLENILDDDCVPDNDTLTLDVYSQDDCPEERGRRVTMAIYVGYLIILNILLVNLLIAIFSNTFEEVQEEADKIWKFQRYSLIYEYYHKPILSPPFSIISYLVSFIRFFLRPIRRKCCIRIREGEKNIFKRLFYYLSKDWRTGFRAKFGRIEAQKLTKWEDLIADEYLHAEEQGEKETQDYKIQLRTRQVLNRKFDEIIDKREDLKEQIDKCEEKIDKVLEILMNNFGSISVKPRDEAPIKTQPTKIIQVKPDRILSPTNMSSLTAVEGDTMFPLVQNEKSRTPHYPKSNITRVVVPDSKVSWSVSWPNYSPVEYTSKLVLSDSKADTNLLAYPTVVRSEIDFNQIDDHYDVDRKSCLGKYSIVDGIPLNPVGRTGLKGRGSLIFWGPNHAIEAIFTRWKKEKNGKHVMNKDNKKILQFIFIEKSIRFRDWYLPHVMLEHTSQRTSVILNNLLTQVFHKAEITDNLDKFKAFLDKGVKIEDYYKDSQRNTDNAWIETTVINYHDETGDLLSKIELNGEGAKWKDFCKSIETECEEDWNNLNRIAQSRHASFE